MTNDKIIIAMSLLIFIGCTNIPLQESVSKSSDEIENKDHLGILDIKSRLLYLVENDSENIYLSIKTDYRPTQMRIMRNGVKIYIDKDGKKKKDTFLHYPTGQQNIKSNRSSYGPGEDKEFDLNRILLSMPAFGNWHDYEEDVSISDGENKNGIEVDVSVIEEDVLYYIAKIPLELIGYIDSSIPSIGLHIAGIEGQKLGSGGMQRSAQQGGGKGGGRGGMSGGGRSGGGMQGQRSGGNMEQMNEMSKPIDIWFRLILK